MTQKKIYQRYINSGAITSIAELLCFVANENLTLTRHGGSYVGVKDATGRRFRLFLPDHPKAAIKAGFASCSSQGLTYDFCIYALFACHADNVACYVGQTRSVSRRIREHWKRRSGTRASGPLFDWAERHEIEVNFVLLQSSHGRQLDANSAEAEWKVRAARSGLHFPSREFLERAMRRLASTDPWPFHAAAHNSQPIEQLATKVIALASIEENSVLCEDGYRLRLIGTR
ncbi:GIY-YIG nuclease family protein [Variovorax humicola]|uniref:GIY-YIG nuclease family protein n=1 Tax=Variovorax humicola TaxID=1769758 RepID=A0ABU8W8Y1_9BURK